jgi:hypothetical protein
LEPDAGSPGLHKGASDFAPWERVLAAFLAAPTELAADTQLDYLIREFVTPWVTSTLARELRRGPSSSRSRIWADTETFRNIQVAVEGNLVQRLRQWRRDGTPVISDFRGYVSASSRHACNDYLRERRPGRHALDTALRVALHTANDLALWRYKIRMDFYEWRCGYLEWKEAGVLPVSLRNNPELRARLWREMREENTTRAESLRRAFNLVRAPLLYTDLLDFLAALWDVEAPYRTASLQYSALRIQSPAATVEDPARVAQLLGTLQEVWQQLRPLSKQQKAVLLLHLPPMGDRNFLQEFVRFGIVEEAQIAEAIGLTLNQMRYNYPLLPLEDSEIADLLGIAGEDIRRIRQDARRRLKRQRPP